MIKKIARTMLTAQILSALTVNVCLLIDNAIIGRFLGVQALAAYGLSSPILLVIGGIGNVLAAGIQVACSKDLGKGAMDEMNRSFSSAVNTAVLVSAFFMIFTLVFRKQLPYWLGAKTEEAALSGMTTDYLTGFALGTPACVGALILVPFLQMAGKSTLLIVAVLGMMAGDVCFDLLSVLVFKNGMFGVGLASSLSYYIALITGAVYFFSRKSAFKYSLKNSSFEKIVSFFKSGFPILVNMASSVILLFLLNKIFMRYGSSIAVAAFTVITSVGNAGNSVGIGVNGVSLTLSGMLCQEEDRTGLKDLMKALVAYGALVSFAVFAVVEVSAPFFVGIFIEDPVTSRLAVLGLRIYALGFIPCSINNFFRGYYLESDRILLTHTMSVLESLVLPLLSALVMVTSAGINGAWYFFVCGEILTFVFITVVTALHAKGRIFSSNAFLLFSDSDGIKEEDMLERNIYSLEDAVHISEDAEKFCLEHGISKRISNHTALCTEEITSNVVKFGFREKRKNHLSVRILCMGKKLLIRFRDDCFAFDPLKYIPKKKGPDTSGIHLIMKMSDYAKYTYTLNMNNLTLTLEDQDQ